MKKIILSFLSIIFMLCLGVGIINSKSEERTVQASAVTGFKMEKGASFRSYWTIPNCGITFGATMSADDNYSQVRLFLAPYDFVTKVRSLEGNYSGELDYVSVFEKYSDQVSYKSVVPQIILQDNRVDFRAGLKNLQDGNLNRPFFGIYYYKTLDANNTEVYVYADMPNGERQQARSMAYVSSGFQTTATLENDVNTSTYFTNKSIKNAVERAGGTVLGEVNQSKLNLTVTQIQQLDKTLPHTLKYDGVDITEKNDLFLSWDTSKVKGLKIDNKTIVNSMAINNTINVKIGSYSKDINLTVNANQSFKLLMIGNSFSRQACTYSYEIAKSLGLTDVTIVNMYYGGCSITQHYNFATQNQAVYAKDTYANEAWTYSEGATLASALDTALNGGIVWDYITLQETSGLSGVSADTDNHLQNLSNLINYVKGYQPTSKILWHMTWAYAQDSTHGDFVRYNSQQTTMYNGIKTLTESEILANYPIDGFVPSGTSIQNARSCFVGDNFDSDGYHLNDIGMYAAGLTIIGKISGLDVSGVSYMPKGLNIYQPAIIESVVNSLNFPLEVINSTIVKKPIIDLSNFDAIDLNLTNSAYWISDSADYNRLVTDAGNSNIFVATKQFSKEEIPVGSIIILNSNAYKYRPDGWLNVNEQNQTGRPDNTTEEVIYATEEWWGNFTHRAFNISTADGVAPLNYTPLRNAFKIFVPLSSAQGLEEYTYTDNAFWDTTSSYTELTPYSNNAEISPRYKATKRFTSQELPVGSVVVITDTRYKFRPEKWLTGQNAVATAETRAGEENCTYYFIEEDFWAGVDYRAFNISRKDGEFWDATDAPLTDILKFYVPNYYLGTTLINVETMESDLAPSVNGTVVPYVNFDTLIGTTANTLDYNLYGSTNANEQFNIISSYLPYTTKANRTKEYFGNLSFKGGTTMYFPDFLSDTSGQIVYGGNTVTGQVPGISSVGANSTMRYEIKAYAGERVTYNIYVGTFDARGIIVLKDYTGKTLQTTYLPGKSSRTVYCYTIDLEPTVDNVLTLNMSIDKTETNAQIWFMGAMAFNTADIPSGLVGANWNAASIQPLDRALTALNLTTEGDKDWAHFHSVPTEGQTLTSARNEMANSDYFGETHLVDGNIYTMGDFFTSMTLTYTNGDKIASGTPFGQMSAISIWGGHIIQKINIPAGEQVRIRIYFGIANASNWDSNVLARVYDSNNTNLFKLANLTRYADNSKPLSSLDFVVTGGVTDQTIYVDLASDVELWLFGMFASTPYL